MDEKYVSRINDIIRDFQGLSEWIYSSLSDGRGNELFVDLQGYSGVYVRVWLQAEENN